MSYCDIVKFDLPLDLASVIAGGIVGFLLVFLVDLIKKPRVKFIGFIKSPSNFGELHKIKFKLNGVSSPGLSRMTISWCGNSVFANWDESPNPLHDDSEFRAELVPATYDQPIFNGNEYSVPLIIQNNGRYEIFSGWWFGRESGYGPKNIEIDSSTEIRVTLCGSGLVWTKEFTLNDL
jgi:hypothetical protein